MAASLEEVSYEFGSLIAVSVLGSLLTAEVGRAVAGEGIGLDERTLIEQLLDALACAQVSCGTASRLACMYPSAKPAVVTI